MELYKKAWILTGCDAPAWYLLLLHVLDIWEHTALKSLGWRTPYEKSTGNTGDIAALCRFKFWDLVLYFDPSNKIPQEGGNERLGRWMGRAKNYGDGMCSWILPIGSEHPIVRSQVRLPTEGKLNAYYQDQIVQLQAEDQQRMEEPVDPTIYYEPGEQVTAPDGTPEVKNEPHTISKEQLLDMFVYDTITTKTGLQKEKKGQKKIPDFGT